MHFVSSQADLEWWLYENWPKWVDQRGKHKLQGTICDGYCYWLLFVVAVKWCECGMSRWCPKWRSSEELLGICEGCSWFWLWRRCRRLVHFLHHLHAISMCRTHTNYCLIAVPAHWHWFIFQNVQIPSMHAVYCRLWTQGFVDEGCSPNCIYMVLDGWTQASFSQVKR